MVTAPANTGITRISRYAVISHVHTNSGILSSVMPGARRFMIVTMMLIDPMIDEAPARWIAKIASGSASPVCSTSGG